MARVLDFRRKFTEKFYFSKIQNRRFEIEKIKKMDYSERAITGRVQAAAKLVLQDLDPEAKKRRQEFMSGKF